MSEAGIRADRGCQRFRLNKPGAIAVVAMTELIPPGSEITMTGASLTLAAPT